MEGHGHLGGQVNIPDSIRLCSLRKAVGNRARASRNLAVLVESELFNEAWKVATEAQKDRIEDYCRDLEKDLVESTCRRITAAAGDLEGRPIRDLREIAKAAGIEYYHHKTKEELIRELKK